MLEKILHQLGLNGKEITVYLASLDIGTAPASTIARRVEIPRNTVRFLLDRLTDKGFVKKTKKANTQLYSVEAPENIMKIFEIRKNEFRSDMDEKISLLQSIAPELASRSRPESTKPKITFYEGDEGLIKVYEDTLTAKEPIRSLASFDGMHGSLPDYFQTYYKRRAEKKIHIRSIHPDTPLAHQIIKNNKAEWRDSQLISAEQYSFDPEIQLYDDKVVITSWQEKMGIIIVSHEIYKAMGVLFDLAWKSSSGIKAKKRKG